MVIFYVYYVLRNILLKRNSISNHATGLINVKHLFHIAFFIVGTTYVMLL